MPYLQHYGMTLKNPFLYHLLLNIYTNNKNYFLVTKDKRGFYCYSWDKIILTQFYRYNYHTSLSSGV
jgi:hypothetical protein